MALSPDKNAPDPKAEVEKYKKALAEDPGSRVFAALADALRRAGEVKAAITVAQDGVKRHPRYMGGLAVLAQACKDDQQFDKALELFNQVTRMNPENITAQKGLAQIYDEIGDHQKAYAAYRVLTMLDPTDLKAKQRMDILEATMPAAKGEERPGTVPRKRPEEKKEKKQKEGKAEEKDLEPARAMEKQDQKDEPGKQHQLPEDLPSIDQIMPPEPLKAKEPETRPKQAEGRKKEQGKRSETPGKIKGSGPRASEEQMLDMFFAGEQMENIGIAEKAHGFVVKSAAEAIPDDHEQGSEIKITSSKMGALFWAQGFQKKALEVMAGELIQDLGNKKLKDEFAALCRKEGIEPAEMMARARSSSTEQEQVSSEKPAAEQEPDPDEDTQPGRKPGAALAEKKPGEDSAKVAENITKKRDEGGNGRGPKTRAPSPGVPDPERIQALKKYIGKIKNGKEKQP